MKTRERFIVGRSLSVIGAFFMMLAVLNGWHIAIRYLSYISEVIGLVVIYSAHTCPVCDGFGSLRGRWTGKEMVCKKCHETVQVKWRREMPDRYKCINVDPRK